MTTTATTTVTPVTPLIAPTAPIPATHYLQVVMKRQLKTRTYLSTVAKNAADTKQANTLYCHHAKTKLALC
jgi:hypothetical protein